MRRERVLEEDNEKYRNLLAILSTCAAGCGIESGRNGSLLVRAMKLSLFSTVTRCGKKARNAYRKAYKLFMSM